MIKLRMAFFVNAVKWGIKKYNDLPEGQKEKINSLAMDLIAKVRGKD